MLIFHRFTSLGLRDDIFMGGGERRCGFALARLRELRSVRQLRGTRGGVPAPRGGAVTAPARPAPGGWETRLLAIVMATLIVFGIAAVDGASSLVAVQQGGPGAA